MNMRTSILLLLLLAAPLGRGVGGEPRISPEYSGITIPPNIAPLNFRVTEPGKAFRVTLRSQAGQPIELTSRTPDIRIPAPRWKELLEHNPGAELRVEIAAQTAAGQWIQYAPILNRIAREPVDSYLAYRQLGPVYNLYANVGIYQRNLTTFEQTEVLENQRFNKGCLNCHCFLQQSPSNMLFHIRSAAGNAMILAQGGEARHIAHTAGYPSWHPSGRLVAYSVNKLSLFFHTKGETRDVFDADSDLNIYRVDSNLVVAPPPIALPQRLETWPSWSPDGRQLYFCSKDLMPQDRFREARYDLMRVSYDLEKDQWGEPERLVSAALTRLSAAQPRVSPDGRWLVFSLCKYGNFPIYQPTADLYLMDLASREYHRLAINSDQTDSWHCWSSNGRWMVFSSKRGDGYFTRPYFTHVDDQGQCSKPFILPQEDPAFYESFLKNFNVPEFIKSPITIPPEEFARAVLAPTKKIVPGKDALHPPKGGPTKPASAE